MEEVVELPTANQESVNWNDLPPEIASEVLSYLGKYDLLKGRLVSKSWSQESINLLKKSQHTISLCSASTEGRKYIQESAAGGGSLLPFPIEWTFYEYRNDDEEIVAIKKSLDDITTLIKLDGFSSITRFKLELVKPTTWESGEENTYGGTQFLEDLLKILSLIAPGLQQLDLNSLDKLFHWNNHIQVPNTIQPLLPTISALSFPNLWKLNCSYSENDDHDPEDLSFYLALFGCCPNLKEVFLPDGFERYSWPLENAEKLRLTNLQNPSEFLNRIRDSPLSSLTNLKVYNFGEGDDFFTGVRDILHLLSPKLLSLRIPVVDVDGDMVIIMFGFPYPLLPHLKHLRMDTPYLNDIPWDQIPLYMEMESTTLPLLTSLDFKPAYCLRILENGERTDSLPNVRRVRLRLDGKSPIFDFSKSCDDEMDMDSRQEFANNFQEFWLSFHSVFPRLQKLSVVSEHEWENFESHGPRVKYLLSEILTHPQAHLLEEIELKNFVQNYLGQMLDEMDRREPPASYTLRNVLGLPALAQYEVDSIILPNLRTITLKQKEFAAIRALPELYLAAMAKHFPNLKQINISLHFFGYETKSKERYEIIQQIHTSYPNWIINIF